MELLEKKENETDLNTSHVNVQHTYHIDINTRKIDLNTSHVNVQHNVTSFPRLFCRI